MALRTDRYTVRRVRRPPPKPRGRASRNDLAIWEDAPLPKLPKLYCAFLAGEGGERTAIEELADYLNDRIVNRRLRHRR